MRSREEFDTGVAALTRKQSRAIETFARTKGPNWKDVIQEALLSTQAGDRIWPEDVSLCLYLKGAIRSISSGMAAKSARVQLECETFSSDQEETSVLDRAESPANQYERAELNQILRKIEKLFEPDAVASQIIELRSCYGYTGEEIQGILRLSVQEYGAAVKRIRRQLEKHFPEHYRDRKPRQRPPSQADAQGIR